ncbi:oligoribonuclease (3'-_5' exoribonuclease) [secondary endosymbiont of Heteropsylla cubana]|uniref:Oligoribonuclease n=1 Tax=secondary endosymbiont of Heteropsylla cubana TaxID=134287 RepID=J3Z590_9ENTR|nr:oligoribonuclease [secondary endosymbiont of Heteropsylla cubana]AFP85479.1 oligoribonuclease (3'->5' exoribonuclease) [secondary endosymbiont of Heteropsylla cubana]
MPIDNNNLIWIDLEMTGLDPQRHRIIEIATLVTNADLTVLATGPVLAIYQSEEQLALMDQWNIKTHTDSGLIHRVRKSLFDEEAAEVQTLSFFSKWIHAKKSPICGNTIAQDRRFLFRYMPRLEAYFHYRYLDVSTLKELAQRWKPEILFNFKKKNTHKALDDIYDTVSELAYYRDYLINI